LRRVIESGSVVNAEYNSAFVLLQYYGYPRRNPDDAPDNNFAGYDFWLNKIDSFSLPGEDMRNDSQALVRVQCAEMVRAFIESDEYQRFFGAAGGNQQGTYEPVSARIVKLKNWSTLFAPLNVFDPALAPPSFARLASGR